MAADTLSLLVLMIEFQDARGNLRRIEIELFFLDVGEDFLGGANNKPFIKRIFGRRAKRIVGK